MWLQYSKSSGNGKLGNGNGESDDDINGGQWRLRRWGMVACAALVTPLAERVTLFEPFYLLVTIPYHCICWSPYNNILSAGHHQCNAGYQITFQWRVLYNANCSALHLVSELVHCNLSAIHWYTPKYRVWFSALHLVSGPVGGWGANDITTFVSLAQTDGDVGGGRGGPFLLVIIILAMQVYTSF